MDRTLIYPLLVAVLVAVAIPAAALSPGEDLLVPAAARVGTWVTDLYIFNPGDQLCFVDLYWLVRDQANPDPEVRLFTLLAGETLVLDDVLRSTFGMEEATGAFRVIADEPVVVNARIYNQQDGVTFGQGLEGVPRGMATVAGTATDIAGLVSSDRFRSNLVVIDASASSSIVDLVLADTHGSQLATASLALKAFEPKLLSLTHLFPEIVSVANASLHAEVTSGAVIIAASKIDNDAATGDPTTLEAWSTACSNQDGTYQVVFYDSLEQAVGGYLVIEDGLVTFLRSTYLNLDKGGDPEHPECDLLFLVGGTALPVHPVTAYADGVSFEQPFTDSGTLSLTLSFVVHDNRSLVGSIDAVGSLFAGAETGCNGAFPSLVLRGGRYSATTETPGECIPAWQCCKVCYDSRACGDSCISLAYTCHQPPGCACSSWEVCGEHLAAESR